jgi:hypothetical protein
MRTLPVAPFDPYAPGWVRELPVTPAILAFAKRRQMQQVALVGGFTVFLVVSLTLVNNWLEGRHGLNISVIAGVISLTIVLAMIPAFSDTGSATYWEAAGPMHGEAIWQMTRAAYALYVGNERLIVPPKAARQIAGEPWGVVMAMRRTAEVIEVRDWYGNIIYRAPGYRP